MYKFILIALLLIGCTTLSQSNSSLKKCDEYHVRYLNECYEKCINGGESNDWCDKECREIVNNKLCK